MRRFYVRNSAGEILDLTTRNVFIHNPAGLGYQRAITSQRVADGFYQTSKREIRQISVAGEIVFTHDAYASYQQLIDWINSTDELSLGYAPYGDEVYWLAVDFDRVVKSELTRGGILQVTFSALGLGLWARETPLVAVIEASQSALTYPHNYPYAYGTPPAGQLDITPRGHVPAAVEIEIAVPSGSTLSDPTLELKRLRDNETLGKMAYTGDISNATLLYSTRPGHDGVWSISGGVKTDLIGGLNIVDNKNFWTIPQGEPCRILITSSNSYAGNATARVHEYFLSV